jgi:aerobic carbon-monoxide dehydrogenase large subunit
VAVFTGTDYANDGIAMPKAAMPRKKRDGSPMFAPQRPALVVDRVRYVGDPVAMVIAETLAQAKDAAEMVAVDYDPLPSVTLVADAAEPDAPRVWDENPDNISHTYERGDRQATEAAFARATRIVKRRYVVSRVHAQYMEPRGAIGIYDPAEERYTLFADVNYPHRVRNMLANMVFKVPESSVRVVCHDVGGGFGAKGWQYVEHRLTLWAARKIERPVKWRCERSEVILADEHGRDNVGTIELAFDSDTKIIGLRLHMLASIGAYIASDRQLLTPFGQIGTVVGMYDIPAACVTIDAVLSNTSPTAPYRGAGRPEASYMLERVIDAAADLTGIDAAELRRRNLIQPEKMPFTTAFGSTYDSGDFPAAFERALKLADYEGFNARRKASKKTGKLRGIGIGCYLEIAGAFPEEGARVSFPGGGKVNVSIGSGASGQAHQTVFGNLAARRLGIDASAVTLLTGDSDRDVPGFGAVASRSAMMCGSAIAQTIDKVLEKGKRVAAMLLQATEGDVVYQDGKFSVKNREVSLFEVAERSGELKRQGVIPESLDTLDKVKLPPSFPNGCHVAEVEINPATGATEIVKYVAVGDCGNVLDDTIVEAQIHGGVAQGIGQALTEDTIYDTGGQLVSGTFMDYAVPRADTVPPMTVEHHPIACRTNPIGAKGTGEAGTTAAPPAVMNAILDALPQGAQLDMPATPQRVWQALQRTK